MANSGTNKNGETFCEKLQKVCLLPHENNNTAKGKDGHLEKLTGALLINKYPAFHRHNGQLRSHSHQENV
jgi:hypothetical protein